MAPPVDVDPRLGRAEAHAAWHSYFSALARREPVVVIVEDIQWADAALLDLLDELAGKVQGPVLFLCLARRELATVRPSWGGGRWNFTSILLEPLPPKEADRLVGMLLPAERFAELRERILERAGGNPFFLEEIARHLQDQSPARDEPEPAPASDALEIPDTVQGVLAARMDLLTPMEKRALQSAAVVGRVFWTGPVAELVGSGRAELDDVMARLEGRGLILARLRSSMGGQREFIFKHVLTRDAAYESLPRRERALAHASVARWLEESTGDREREFAELLAHHYSEAYRGTAEHRAPDEETGALRAQAFRFCLLASEEARSKLALRGAAELADQALSMAADPLERGMALEARGEAAYLDSNGDVAWSSLRDAVWARREAGSEDAAAIVRLCARALEVATRGRGTMRTHLEETQTEPLLRLAMESAEERDSVELARLLMVRAFWPLSFAQPAPRPPELDDARAAGERSYAMSMRLGRPDLASAALDGVGASFAYRGLYGRMDSVLERRLALARSLDDPWEAGDAFAVAAWAAFHVGRYGDSLALASEGLERTGAKAPIVALHCLDWRAQARCRLGQWSEFFDDVALASGLLGERNGRSGELPAFAVDHLGAAALVREVLGDSPAADRLVEALHGVEGRGEHAFPSWAPWLALLFSRRGRYDEAWECLSRPEFEGNRYWYGPLLEATCDVMAAQGLWDRAPATVAEARRHAEEAGLLALRCFADRLEGLATLAGGDAEGAASSLSRAAKGFAELGARWEEARTNLHLAVAVAARDPERARRLLLTAEEVFEELGSRRELSEAARSLEMLA